MPDPASWIPAALLALLLLIGFAFFSRWLLRNPRDDVEAGMLWHGVRIYSRLTHKLEIRGRENIPQSRHPGPLILVINHTAGVDPVLVQAAVPFEIRWVMASDMRHPLGEWMWRWGRVIFVDRTGNDALGAREAIRHVIEGNDGTGGVLAIFPEGFIERPPRTLLPFQPGVGLIIRRARARVLPVIIEGTPQPPRAPHAWSSLWQPSRSIVTFYPPIDYTKERLGAEEIAEDLRRRFAAWTNWPLAEGGALRSDSRDGPPGLHE